MVGGNSGGGIDGGKLWRKGAWVKSILGCEADKFIVKEYFSGAGRELLEGLDDRLY